jgi:hypothetical protein
MDTMIQIKKGNKSQYYLFNGIAYDIHFPLEWAANPKICDDDFICDPSHCKNCFDYGSYNGVFIGYCANCAQEYNYERGNGFISSGKEIKKGLDEKNSAWNTYLKNVILHEIGYDNNYKKTKQSSSFEPCHVVQNTKEEDQKEDDDAESDEIPWFNCEIEENDFIEPDYYHCEGPDEENNLFEYTGLSNGSWLI